SDRNFAGFSGVFRLFQRQIHERRGSHASYHRKKPATRNAFSKSGYRFCVRMRLEPRARALSLCQPVHGSLIAISSTVRLFMPRDNDKDNDSRGRRDRPSGGKGRSGAARGPEKKFAKRGFGGKDFAGKSDSGGERRPYAGKS